MSEAELRDAGLNRACGLAVDLAHGCTFLCWAHVNGKLDFNLASSGYCYPKKPFSRSTGAATPIFTVAGCKDRRMESYAPESLSAGHYRLRLLCAPPWVPYHEYDT